jgi:hypothetical protein
MRKLVVTLLVLSFVLAGVSLAVADNLPKSLKGVDLSVAKKVTDKEAKVVKGAALNNVNPTPGVCRDACTTTTCIPNTYLAPGPHK